MCELGQTLKKAREDKGYSLAEAADLLNMRKVMVEAFEECHFELLPEAPLARGYLKQYAKLLSLDPAPLLALYPTDEPRNRTLIPKNPTLTGAPKASGAPTSVVPLATQTSRPAQASQPQRGGLAWLWGVPIGLLIGVAGWWFLTRNPLPAQVAPPAQTQPAPVVTPTLPLTPRQISLRIATQPVGARVFLDGFLLGQAPLEARIEEGERTLRIEAAGFQSYEQVINLNTNRNLSVNLSRIPSTPASPSATNTPNPANPTANPNTSLNTTDPNATPNPNNPTQTPAQPTQSGAITIRMDGRSWIRVVNASTGQALYEGIPAQGAQLNYPGPVLVRAGNAGAVRVLVNGQDRGLMGREGQVLSQRYGQ